MAEIRKASVSDQNELYVYMEALKITRKNEETRKSIRVSWKLNAKVAHFDWYMLEDNGDPFSRWNFTNTDFVWVIKEDQSSYNTLEIDSIFVENLMKSAISHAFRETISGLEDVNSSKQKLLRLIWRENPPVGGISVVEHFELNISRIRIQITTEYGRALMKYLFAESEKLEKADSSTDISNSKKEEKLSPLSRSQILKNIKDEKQNDILEMQNRAQESRSFIYIKVPGNLIND
jgi:hypothetical protein